ncbi:hypothetical protein OSB04_024220 [Centaurea solstitialis]|uniref:BED-type domain-containing protein n=1 Tax=Centaurea solstitialis TaxID=347529 RepID=A0AA38SLB6_9ASTR|nr:hypothetical protein OSB04_024220 [Centaurea solstitialis]
MKETQFPSDSVSPFFLLWYLCMESTASSMASTACQELKRKSTDVGWEYGVLVDPNKIERVRCLLCGKEMGGGINRLKYHNANITGNVKPCPKSTKEDQLRCRNALNEVKAKKKGKQDDDNALREDVNIGSNEPIDIDEMDAAFGSIGNKPPHSFGPMDKFATMTKSEGKSKQEDAISSVVRKEMMIRAKEYICRWAYECAIPFHAFEKDSFKRAAEAIGQYRPRLPPPTRYEMGDTYLKKEVEKTKNTLKKYQDEWKSSGCTIMTDAWSDRKRRSIMNLCVNSRLGTIFLSSKEFFDVAHTSEVIFEYVDKCIDEVGHENVVQIVTDNASNNMGATKLLKLKRPKIFWTSCAAHTLLVIDNTKIIHVLVARNRFGGRGTEKYGKRRENVKNAQSQHRRHLAIAKSHIWRRQVRLKCRLGLILVFGVAKWAVWRSPDGSWSFFFKYQPPPSVLDMSFEVRYTRGIQRNESESTKGADTLRKSISDHLSLYCRYHVDALVYDNLTVPSGRYDTWTFLHYITHDQVRLPVYVVRRWLGIRVTADLLEPFEEPEREFRKRNKKKSKANKVRPRALIFEMGDEAPMWTARRAAPTVPTNPITKPNLNKEIPGKLLRMIKDLTYDGKSDSNPIVHMENFVDICDLFKTEESRDDVIRLRVFPLTLTGEARAWLRSLEPSSITTWEGLRSKFLSRFFPPSKIDKLRAEIRSFQQQDGETISEAWERFKHLLNSCPSHELNKSEQVQTFYSGLAYSSRATLDSSAGGVFMYKTPTEGYKLLEDMLIHNIDWRTDKRLQIPRMAGKISSDFDPSDELAAMKNQQVKFERKIKELIKSVHALQVGCEECNGPHLTKDCPNKPMMTPEEVNYINRGDYQGRWNNNRNFIPRPPGFFAPTQQNQRSDGEPRMTIEDRIIQFMDAQKKLNDEVGSYLRNHQSTIQNLELQVGRVSQMLSERTQGELPTQTQVNPKVENAKPMLMITGEPSKKKWTDIYTKKYVETESESEPDYATDYDSEGFIVSFEHLRLKVPEASSEDEDEEDGKQGGYAEFMIPKKEDKGKEKEKARDDDLIYIAPIKHDLGSYNLPISCHKFSGLALVDSGAALNMMPVCYCRKMGVKWIVPTNYQYRGVNGYMTTPLGIAEGVPIRIGKFVYYTDFVIANLP